MLEAASPKSHRQEVTVPWEVSLNRTVKGALPLETSKEKDATGGGTGVGVGVGWAQATSSNALNAKNNCKRKSVRMGRILVRSEIKSNPGSVSARCRWLHY